MSSLTDYYPPPSSVTRFGGISPFWQNLHSLRQFLSVYLLFRKILERLWQISNAIGQVFIDMNGQLLKNYLAIWSHCPPPSSLGTRKNTWRVSIIIIMWAKFKWTPFSRNSSIEVVYKMKEGFFRRRERYLLEGVEVRGQIIDEMWNFQTLYTTLCTKISTRSKLDIIDMFRD